MTKTSKSIPDPKKVLLQKEKNAEIKKEMGRRIGASEKPSQFIKTWDEHVKNRSPISNYTVIANDKMYNFTPKEGQIFLPFSEYNGDHSMNWVICWDEVNKVEVFRKNIRTVDMIEWL